jgi:hypothetical protein
MKTGVGAATITMMIIAAGKGVPTAVLVMAGGVPVVLVARVAMMKIVDMAGRQAVVLADQLVAGQLTGVLRAAGVKVTDALQQEDQGA